MDPWINVTSPSLPTTPKLPAHSPPKEEGKGPPVSKETGVSGGGIINKPVLRHPPVVGRAFLRSLIRWTKIDLLIDNNPLASGSKVTAEGRRDRRAPPQETKENNCKELGVGLNFFFCGHHLLLTLPLHEQTRKDLDPRRRPTYAEMAAKAKVTPKERRPDFSGSTAELPLQTNTSRPTTPGPPTQLPPKEGRFTPMPKESNVFGGGITNRSAPGLPLAAGRAFPHFPCLLVES